MQKKSPKPTDKYVGSQLRMRRLLLRITQKDLAEGLGLTFQQVQKYETGTNRMSPGRLQQAAHILKVPVTFFFDGAQHISSARDRRLNDLTDFMTTPEGLKLAKSFMRISNVHVRRRIVDLVEQIYSERN
jgi:transcriptional regulator with XRE-family HTH domain